MIGKTRYQVRLFLNEKSKEFTAMADSGNRLVEPVTGKPVSIIAAADAKEFLGEKAGVLMIPYRAVGTENGMLPGVLFDRMEVMSEECGSIRIERPIVAISKEPLFFGKDFTMILPECLVSGENVPSSRETPSSLPDDPAFQSRKRRYLSLFQGFPPVRRS